MSDEVSIRELEKKRLGMSDPDDYSHDENGNGYRSFDIKGQDTACFTDNSCDARGIVATVKAAPVLIAATKAALRYIELIDTQGKLTPEHLTDVFSAKDELRAALRKVRP